MIPNDMLECFILGFGLEIPENGLGRPTTFAELCVAAKKKCDNCSSEELLDALYILGRANAELYKLAPVGAGFFQPVSFERMRNTPR